MTPPPREQGMALVTVLLLVAVAAAVLGIMMSGEDAALQRATLMADAARARAVASAGEASAIAALRRDTHAESDDATEPWANIAEKGTPIKGGSFALAIADAQGKLNLNALARGDQITRARLAVLAAAFRLPPDTAARIAALIRATGPIADLAQLGGAGVAPGDIARLATVATVLPVDTTVNLNAAPEPLLALLLNDPVVAHSLVARRARRGLLTPDDLVLQQVRLPPGAGFTSSLFWVRTRATVGNTRQELTSLLLRRKTRGGRQEVVAIGRWRGAAAPIQAPG